MKPQAKMKILIIDDSEFDRRMIMQAMKSVCENLTCVELSSGASAVEIMREENPSLTIVDIRMPGISGWDVLDNIRTDKALRESKVVMMSGTSSEMDVQKATTSGAQGFYKKPHTRSDYGTVASSLKASFLNMAA